MFQLPALTVPMGSTALQAAIAAPRDSSTVVVVTSFNRLRLWTALHTLMRPARTSS